MNGAERDDTRPQMRAFAVLVALALLLAGFLLKDQILSRVIANYAAIQMINAPGLQLIDFRAYPTCQNSDRYVQPASLFNRAVELDPHNQAAWQNLLKVRWAAGDCAAVEQMLTPGLVPEDTSMRLISALLDIQGGRFQGRASYPGAAEIGRLLAEAGLDADDQGLIDEAAQWYNSAFLLDPNLKTAEWLANHYAALGDNDHIAWVWDYLAQEKAGTDEGWWARYHQARLAGDTQAQIAALKAGAESSAEPFQFWVDLGHVYKQAQDYANALRAYEAAHRLWPNQISPVIYIGDVYLETQDYETAEKYFAQAHSMDVSNHFVYYYMSVTYYGIGDLDAAIKELRTGIELQEQKSLNPWEWYKHLGNWYIEAGLCADAKSAFEHALELQPREASLSESLRNIEACISD